MIRKIFFTSLISVFLLTMLVSAIAAQAPAGREYVVQADDWLSKIAEKEYGDMLAYQNIVEATNAKAAEDNSFTAIDNPDVLEVGQKLWLPGSSDAPSTTPAEANGQLSIEQLKNATYSGIYDEPVTLTNGKYEGAPFVEGGAARPTVTFFDGLIAYGDLNGDSVDDSAVLLVENSGGSGVFTYVAAVLNQNGQPVDAGSVWVGDRTQIKSMVIENQQVLMEIVTQGSDDAQCCPTLKVRKTYALQDGQLAEVGSEELGTVSAEDLNGTNWVLSKLSFDQPALAEAEVTASFAAEQISGLAGCNNYSGGFSSDSGQALTFGPLISTQMMCEEAVSNQEFEYLQRLQTVSQWSYFGGQLALSYQTTDGAVGTLLYNPQPAAAESMDAMPSDTPAETVAATEVITFKPTAVPQETRAGSCFTNAIGLGREDAYRCTVGNEIFDPCFLLDDATTVVCNANPTTGEIGFVLALTEPLPAPDSGSRSMPWLIELADGQVCGLMTGTVPGVGERTAPYGCPDQSYLFEDFQTGDVWLAEKAVIGLNDNGFFVEQSEMVPLVRVWQ